MDKKQQYHSSTEEIGQRIKQAREKAGLTQKKLAKRIGLRSGEAVSFLEHGKRDPCRYIEKISQATHYPIDWFYSGKANHRQLVLLKKAQKYDELAEHLKDTFSEICGQTKSKVRPQNGDDILENLGISDDRSKEFFKAYPTLLPEEKEGILQTFYLYQRLKKAGQ